MIQYQINFYDSLDSTNSEVKRLCDQGMAEGAVVVAAAQTSGRGRLGRSWVSPLGNLYFSILLKPKVTLDVLSQLSLVAGIALAQTIKYYQGNSDGITLKWPNDVLLKCQKAAGILVETEIESSSTDGIPCYLGIGVNFNSAPDLTVYPATCLNEFLNIVPEVEDFLQQYLIIFSSLYEIWQKRGFSVLKSEWLEFAHGLGQTVTAIAGREGLVTGVFETITDQGGLVIKDQIGKKNVISSSEVTFPH